MTFFPPTADDPAWTARRAVIVPSGEGETRVINGDVFTVKLRAALSTGSLGFLEADVPPGIGADPHAHGTEDEAFYLVSGDVEFLNGDTRRLCRAGDFVFIPRGTRHGYTNVGSGTAKLLVFFTPGGAEDFWLEVGEPPTPRNIGVPWNEEQFKAIEDPLRRYNMTMYPEEFAPHRRNGKE
ncbi:cupin domain-containing protein [Saccharothrix coeruleofusca]|uniref:Cupin type-2 domain-containing protein n=1 Tax=Saccharothrix coeruleofusca TaxID=33919 RepID=A0A918ARM7_9PSEU|nr:cupin domain-containing protein [Saccharothrix coeruleofusca]MBP2337189.1 mannose-6-phosphate isomerase-like protein (cupin superfamily) [Saccharothrix coeruleofusca]GGP66538.1 hypothetical protein GCM10010185_44090 [Saccharothrix coeruleofusca]